MSRRRPDRSAEPAGPAFDVPALNAAIVETDELIAQIKILGRTQCSVEEAAAFLGFVPSEFRQFLLSNKRSFQAWFTSPAAGRAALRMAQLKAAQQGDARMLVWLGKQYLGQTDKAPSRGGKDRQPRSDWDDLSTWRMTKIG